MLTDKNFSIRLNACLDKAGFPPKNKGRIQLLAEMVGLSHRGASKWINGETTPPAKKYADLAKKLAVNEAWLRTGLGAMYGYDEQTYHPERANGLAVNVYSLDAFSDNERGITKSIQCDLPYQGHFFAIELDTEAMSPRFPPGSTIIFDELASPKDGDFVLVKLDDFPVPIFRQLLIMGGVFYLQAHNPKFERLVVQDTKQILGKLVQAVVNFD